MTSRLTTSAVSPICSRETSSVPLKLMRLYSALRIEASIFVQASKRPSRLPNLHSGGRIKLKDMPKQQSIQNFFGNGSQKRPSDTQPVASLSNKRVRPSETAPCAWGSANSSSSTLRSMHRTQAVTFAPWQLHRSGYCACLWGIET